MVIVATFCFNQPSVTLNQVLTINFVKKLIQRQHDLINNVFFSVVLCIAGYFVLNLRFVKLF